MNKNDIVELSITDVTAEGSGVGKYEKIAVFVPNTAIGDRIRAKIVKVKSSYAFAIAEEIITPSKNRAKNDCPYFPKCGGCVFRHIDYTSELEIKKHRVYETIKRIGGIELSSLNIVGLPEPDAYRNKAQFPISSAYETGFFAPRSHRVIPIKNCRLLPDVFSRIAECVSDFLKSNNISVYNEESGTGLVRHLYIRKGAVSGEIMVALVINGETLPRSDELTDRLTSLLGEDLKSFQININRNKTNVILGNKNKVIYGKPYITDTLCGVKLRLSPFTFYQVNHDMAELLYKKVKEYANPKAKNIIDLYCGAGSIGLSLCDEAKSVIGVEIVPEAVMDAKINAEENGIKNAEFICGDAKSAAESLAKIGVKADVVIVDPPRKGCEAELLNTISTDFAPEKIVYVSCDPGTLARDLKILNSSGYEVKGATAFDMFPRTAHCEVVCKLLRSDIKS